MSRWENIGSAPKTGEHVLVYERRDTYTQEVMEAYWKERWYNDATNQGWMPANLDEEYGNYINPSHWMPLPAPPEA